MRGVTSLLHCTLFGTARINVKLCSTTLVFKFTFILFVVLGASINIVEHSISYLSSYIIIILFWTVCNILILFTLVYTVMASLMNSSLSCHGNNTISALSKPKHTRYKLNFAERSDITLSPFPWLPLSCQMGKHVAAGGVLGLSGESGNENRVSRQVCQQPQLDAPEI